MNNKTEEDLNDIIKAGTSRSVEAYVELIMRKEKEKLFGKNSLIYS